MKEIHVGREGREGGREGRGGRTNFLGDFEKKLWKSDDVVLFGNLSLTRLGLGGGRRMRDFGEGGGRLGIEL